MNTHILGVEGETRATEYLHQQNYKILERNFKTHIGEVDIIANDNDITVFIEVKDRQTKRFGMPREAVTFYKQNKIRLVATQYLQKHKLLDSKVRFDVVEILGDEITHIKNAF